MAEKTVKVALNRLVVSLQFVKPEEQFDFFQ